MLGQPSYQQAPTEEPTGCPLHPGGSREGRALGFRAHGSPMAPLPLVLVPCLTQMALVRGLELRVDQGPPEAASQEDSPPQLRGSGKDATRGEPQT